MLQRLIYWGTAACIAAAFATSAVAQDETAVFRSDTKLVVLHATVLDEQGNLVTNLPQNAFRVFENGVAQDLKVFRREDSAVSIGLVIDDSGSMYNKRDRVAAAGVGFLRASHEDDEAFVMHFNEKAYLDTDFTGDIAKLQKGLTTFDSKGTTSMRDAIRLSTEHLTRKGREDKKVLLVVTDGEDNSSTISRDYIVKQALQAGVLIYTIGILHESDDTKAKAAQRELETLARETGGQSFFLNSVEEIGRTAERIARDIRNQYTIGYAPSNEAADGTYRKIEVEVEAQTPLLVRARAGYWAGGAARAEAGAVR